MNKYFFYFNCLIQLALGMFLVGCAVAPPTDLPIKNSENNQKIKKQMSFELPDAWGGKLHCVSRDACFLIAVEHEISQLVLIKLDNNQAIVLDKKPLAYHPDSAIWLTDDIVAAAVETGGTLDFFKVENQKLTLISQTQVAFSPRDIVLVEKNATAYKILATPYSGKEVAWVDWNSQAPNAAKVQTIHWCEAPWHPVLVKKLPQSAESGLVVACLDDKKIIAVPASDWTAKPSTLASFDVIPRQARPSPSGAWLFVALETGGKNARIHMQTGELQWIEGNPGGSSSVVAVDDSLVIWGDSQDLTLQKLDSAGLVLESRNIKTTGYSTNLQLHDINHDGSLDILVLNSSGNTSDIIFGPIWEDVK